MLRKIDVGKYYEWAIENGAKRLVITGGGEPLLDVQEVLRLIGIGSRYFDEIACFTNGTYLTKEISSRLLDQGLSYICYSRHHYDDGMNNEIMGKSAPSLYDFILASEPLIVRAICVMAKGYIDSKDSVQAYIKTLEAYGVNQYTFKHTYIAYEQSIFSSNQNQWAMDNKIEFDPFEGQGVIIGELPWGPKIREITNHQVCYYYEPNPEWERRNKLCRSSNLLSDGKVYASLEDQQSLLYQLTS
jgi:cyclic pyranopterin phosphate synthase